jgi:hypothetical protein
MPLAAHDFIVGNQTYSAENLTNASSVKEQDASLKRNVYCVYAANPICTPDA